MTLPKTLVILEFDDYTCDIDEDGDLFLSDYHAEHSIYIYKKEFDEILKEYKKWHTSKRLADLKI